jgi:hypothetical protein
MIGGVGGLVCLGPLALVARKENSEGNSRTRATVPIVRA